MNNLIDWKLLYLLYGMANMSIQIPAATHIFDCYIDHLNQGFTSEAELERSEQIVRILLNCQYPILAGLDNSGNVPRPGLGYPPYEVIIVQQFIRTSPHGPHVIYQGQMIRIDTFIREVRQMDYIPR